MQIITGLRSVAIQNFQINIDEGTIYFTFTYKPAVSMWFMDITFNETSYKGLRLCLNTNLMYNWEKLIPFGIMCYSDIHGYEPTLITDLYYAKVKVAVITKEEIAFITSTINEQE